MESLNFNVSQFIAEVRSRPLLYDNTSELYLEKDAKIQAWEEILETLYGPETRTEDEKAELVGQLQKKWKNIRDTFVRECRKGNGNNKSKKRRYRYYKDLMFLLGMVKSRDTGIGLMNSKNEEKGDKSKVMDSICTSTASKKTAFHSVDKKRRRQEAENRRVVLLRPSPPPMSPVPVPPPVRSAVDDESDKLFLLSLLSDMKRVPDQLKLEVKCELMNVIKRYSSFSNPQDSLQTCVFTVQEEPPAFTFKSSPQHSSEESD